MNSDLESGRILTLPQAMLLAEALSSPSNEPLLRTILSGFNGDTALIDALIALVQWKRTTAPDTEKALVNYAVGQKNYFILDEMCRTLRYFNKTKRCAGLLSRFIETIESDQGMAPEKRLAKSNRLKEFQSQLANQDGQSLADPPEKTRLRDNIDIASVAGSFEPALALDGGWYRNDDIRFYPRAISSEDDFKTMLRHHLVSPSEFSLRLDESARFVTLGSCFAQNVRRFMSLRGFPTDNIEVPHGLNNAFAVEKYIEMVATGEVDSSTWYVRNSDGKIVRPNHEARRRQVFSALENANCVILTYGLSEVWRDRETGEVFWMGVPEEIFNSERHEFWRSTTEDNASAIERTLSRLLQINPALQIVVTVSPIPLTASFSAENCITADARSKSVLRAAVSQVVDKMADPRLHYWPSFEAFRWLGAHVSYPTIHHRDARHPDPKLIEVVVELFLETILP